MIFSVEDARDNVPTMPPPAREDFEIWPEQEKDACSEFRKIRSYHPPAAQLKTTWGFFVLIRYLVLDGYLEKDFPKYGVTPFGDAS